MSFSSTKVQRPTSACTSSSTSTGPSHHHEFTGSQSNHIPQGPSLLDDKLICPMAELAHERQFVAAQEDDQTGSFEEKHLAMMEEYVEQLEQVFSKRNDEAGQANEEENVEDDPEEHVELEDRSPELGEERLDVDETEVRATGPADTDRLSADETDDTGTTDSVADMVERVVANIRRAREGNGRESGRSKGKVRALKEQRQRQRPTRRADQHGGD